MSTTNNETKNGLTIDKIEISDTLSQFVEKCNNNFSNIMKCGGGPAGSVGSQGSQGVPTKPKVPIHVWLQGVDYETEIPSKDENGNDIFEIKNAYDTSDVKYQAGHLIMLQNAHVYILELDVEDNTLKPNFILALQSYDPGSVIDGKNAIVHIAYANAPNSTDGFVIDQQLTSGSVVDRPYMGIYSDNNTVSSSDPSDYIWFRIQGSAGPKGNQGERGPQGPQGQPGPKGEDYTAQFFSIDLDGDMSTILLDTDGTTLYDTTDINSYCKCTLHAYYGKTNVNINKSNVTISAPSGYSMGENLVVKLSGQDVGAFTTEQSGNDVSIKFVPNGSFDFRQKTLSFTINVYSKVYDENTKTEYEFERSTIWIIKGIVSDFKLEIIPSHRTIKKLEGGSYYPEFLQVNVYKTSGEKREPFNDIYSKDSQFKLLYKDYNVTNWSEYTSDIHKTGISTSGHSCLEFKVVRYPGENEEIWDYEDVWVVADGKGTHYYHADLGSTESMMVLTTGVKKTETINGKVIEYTELRNKSGYSITFNPKFYDGTEELTVSDINIGSNSGEAYYTDGSFERNLTNNTFTITRVPYGVEVIPMTFDIWAENNKYRDTVAFNVYISTSADLYTLVPSVSSYNTSTGSSGDTIGCDVYKNNIKINQSDLNNHSLVLKYIIHSEKNTQGTTETVYTEPIGYSVDEGYGEGNDTTKDIFTASDVAIEFILYCNSKAVVRSSVPLIKDGINGADGDCWQYIFFKTCYDKFDSVVSVFGDGINPNNWDVNNDPSRLDSNAEYLGDKDIEEFLKSHPDKQPIYDDIMSNNSSPWTDNPSGVDKENRYEYQSYRKWDKDNHCWGKYGNPTLYSTYSVDGAPGASAVHMELSQDYIAVPYDPVYKCVHKLYTENISTRILLYYGDILINSNSITYSFEIDGKIYKDSNKDNIYIDETDQSNNTDKTIKHTNNDGTFEFNKSLFSKDTYIKCIATYNGVPYEKTLLVDLEESPYELEIELYQYSSSRYIELDKHVIIRDVNLGELPVDRIIIGVKVWNNGQWIYFYDNNTFLMVTGDSSGSLFIGERIYAREEPYQPGVYRYCVDKNTIGYPSCEKINFDNLKKNITDNAITFAIISPDMKTLTYETIGIINSGKNGERGGSGYGALLSNPISVIPVGDDWKTDENVENQHDSTLVYLYGNSTDISRQITISIPNPDESDDKNLKHFSIAKDDSINKVVFTPVVEINGVDHAFDFGSNAQYKLPIEIEYQADNFTTTTNWTLTPIRGLEDVEVYVDKRTVNTTTQTEHTLNVGYYLTTPNGVKTLITNAGKNTKGYKIILTNNTQVLTQTNYNNDVIEINNNSTTWSAIYSFVKNDENRNCYVVLVDKDNNILDYTEVMAVSDGVDGTSAVHLELTQDYIAVPSKPGGGGVHPGYGSVIKSQMLLYEGDTQIDHKDISQYTIKIGEETQQIKPSNGVFEIKSEKITSDTTVLCGVYYNNNYFYKNLIIDLEETPYELELDKNILVRDVNNNNTITNSDLTVKVKYWMSGTWNYINTGFIYINATKKGWVDLSSNNTIILSNYIGTNDTEVRISYYESLQSTKELSYEILGIINSGMNGTDGSSGSDGKTPELIDTTRVGFSTEEHKKADGTPNENADWKSSIDKLKELKPGQQIYILYKQKWTYKEDKDTIFYTYYISTTMSGTQGIDGKSRVLFYLGSFESKDGKIPTLTGETVSGTLSDTRCDYYIDANGTAWMRKGEEGTKDGLSRGNTETGYKEYWEESDKVGFLQAGAITADMINTATIAVDNAFITNLQITDANISGQITANKIKVDDIRITNANISGDLSGNIIRSNKDINGNEYDSTKNIPASWQINPEGNGWLANKNIEWTTNGDITIKKGKIESGSTFGSWYTWNDGTISTISEGEQNSKSDAVRFSSDGSGHLCYKNISWDKDGNLFLGGLEGNEVVIGKDTWIVTKDGIKTKSHSAEFNNDGSGQIGGYYTDKQNNKTDYKKGISWNNSGDIYFHNRIITKPMYIEIDGTSTENSHSISLDDITESTFIFINKSESNNEDCSCYRVWLSWFWGGWYDKNISVDDNTLTNFTLINHTNKTLEIYINEDSLYLPFRESNNCPLPIHNYTLKNNRTFGKEKIIIQTLYILPGSKLELLLEKHDNKNTFYINNISDFRLSFRHNDENKPLGNLSLLSTNYDLNTFTNQGGYNREFNTETPIVNSANIRLIFGNRISTICAGTITQGVYSTMKYTNSFDDVDISTYKTYVETENGDINVYYPNLSYNLNDVYHNIEHICDITYTDNISVILNITENSHSSTYEGITTTNTCDKVRLICYSPQYFTTYIGEWVDITSDTLNKNILLNIKHEDQRSLCYLAQNQLNGILDVFVSLDFNVVKTTEPSE